MRLNCSSNPGQSAQWRVRLQGQRPSTNSKLPLLFVLGTRPEAIKLAPVIRKIRDDGGSPRLLFTAQHRTLASDVLEYFGIVPDFDLDIMIDGQSPSGVAARVLEGVDSILELESPEVVIVQGDTTTAMATALAAFHRRIPVAHVEAGLRSGVIDDPFPEEVNRRLIARVASRHFAPTERNRANLLAEGVRDEQITVTGNTVIDALEMIMADRRPELVPPICREFDERKRKLVLLTTHRRENFGAGQRGIFRAVRTIVDEIEDIEIVFPMHPNPEVAKGVAEHLPDHPRIHRISPIEYPSFIHLLSRAWLIMTDSGGLQEEAPALGVPTLVLRRTTERPELVESGSGLLVGIEAGAIVEAVACLHKDSDRYRNMARRRHPFGASGAAAIIARWAETRPLVEGTDSR